MDSSVALRQQYDSMSGTFLREGLALGPIAAVRERYRDSDGLLTPINYTEFPERLEAKTVRLVVIPLVPQATELVSHLEDLSEAFRSALPAGTDSYTNDPERWHVTIFHTSKFDDTRPKPLEPAASDLLSDPPAARPLPTAADLKQERQAMQQAIAETQPLQLEVHRVLIADSGTLLLCLVDVNSHLTQLRQKVRATFPGAPMRQTQIMHVSVLRLLSVQQLDVEQRQQLQAVCDAFTSKLKGKRLNARLLWYILESRFSNIEGEVHEMLTG